MTQLTLRRANMFDSSEILRLLAEWFEEVSIPHFPPMCEYTGVFVADMIANHIVVIGEYNGEIVGVLGLKASNFGWNNEVQILSNEFIMTKKSARSTGVGVKLIQEAKDIADKCGVAILFGHMTGTDAELKDRYVRMCGFSYAGGNFLYKGQ